MVIAIGSYPIGRRFESHRRYQKKGEFVAFFSCLDFFRKRICNMFVCLCCHGGSWQKADWIRAEVRTGRGKEVDSGMNRTRTGHGQNVAGYGQGIGRV